MEGLLPPHPEYDQGAEQDHHTYHAYRSQGGHLLGCRWLRNGDRDRVIVDALIHVLTNHLDLVIAHQANIRILWAMAKKMNLPKEKVYLNIDRYGNMSSASSAIALTEAVAEGKIKKGDFVILVAFGAGLTWGGIAIKW